MKRIQKSNFTLIELLAAMGIFTIIMLIVFQMLASSQKVWSLSETNTRIYENARIALDVITRDLQCAIASNRHGGEIPFWTGIHNASTGEDLLAFVSAVDPSTSADSKLCEIIFHNDTTNNELKRSVVDDGSANWDFYGQTTDTNLFTVSSGRQTVIRGVDNLFFICYEADGDVIGDTDADDIPDTNTTVTTLPAAVYVSITLFDPKLSDVWGNLPDAKKNQSRRTFTKMIYLKTGALGN